MRKAPSCNQCHFKYADPKYLLFKITYVVRCRGIHLDEVWHCPLHITEPASRHLYDVYRVKLNIPKKVLRVKHTKFHLPIIQFVVIPDE